MINRNYCKNGNNKNNIIRKTTSRCVVCSQPVDASLIKVLDKVFLEKFCPVHGSFCLLISEHADEYMDLEKFYFNVSENNLNFWALEVDLTFECNMECPICAWGEDVGIGKTNNQPVMDEIKRLLIKTKAKVIRFSGGEPTCRNDLFDIIKMAKKLNKKIILNTNGLKLANFEYVKKLKQSGVDCVNLTFDGFNIEFERNMRGNNYLEPKLKALENLNSLCLPTGLNIRVVPEGNEAEIPKIIDLAKNNKNIKLLSFGTVGYLGHAQKRNIKKYLMPDQLVDIVVENACGLISRESIRLFQKFFITVNSFFTQRWCFYDSAAIILVRDKDSLVTLDKYIDLHDLEKILDNYADKYKHNKILAKICLLLGGIKVFFKIKNLRVIKEIVFRGISFFMQKKKYLNSQLLIYVSINTSCDRYKMDDMIAKNCIFSMAFKDENNKLSIKGSGAFICDKISSSSNKNQLKFMGI
ncbi:MAG: radical SAM protein [Candidatus Omnitrophota bacterium]